MASKNSKKRSLSFILSVIIALIIVVVFSIFLGIMRTNFVNTSEALYVNQLQNFSNDIARQMADTLENEIKNATFLSKDQRIITAMKTGKYEMARPLLKSFFYEKGIYEQVFMSTLEKNSRILVSADGKADGVRWGNIPEYAENAARAMQGQIHTSNPGKSPVTGLAVIVVSAPIMDDSTPIGIIGLPVDVGLVSKRIVKKIKIGKTGYPFITNSEGLTFAHPDEKNIFTLNLKEYEWGREILAKPSGTVIHYDWEGKGKILTFHKDEKFKFVSAATLYKDDYMSDIHRLDLLLFPMAVVLIAVSIIFITVFMRRRLRPLSDCEAVMIGMAEGNLTLRYTGVISNDEIGSIAGALNNTLEQFERLISEIISTSKNLSQAVNEISSGNQNLSQRTSEQASSLEEVASTIEEATAAIRQNADNSTEADKLSNNTMKLAEEGNRVVIEAVESINEMSKSSKKIEEIISVINEIAFQTNLLALNAAVEAARAGEQGRGFAVVAGEVRNLAQRSGNAAKEISNLIKDSLGKITTGTELVNKSGEALSEIVSSMKNMARLISEIAASSQEQKQGIDQINIAISEMDTLTQQNAALVEETAATSEEVASQAKELENMVEKFVVNEYFSDTITAKYIEKKEKHLLTDSKTKKVAKEEPKAEIPVAKKEKAEDTGTVLKEEGFEEF